MTKGCRFGPSSRTRSSLHSKWIGTSLTRGAAILTLGIGVRPGSLNSESPGLILDRLSILALKIFHTREETLRDDALEAHVARNKERLRLLEEQRSDLAGCLDRLWKEILHGERRFKLYRQLKMYNDPSLNPAVYRKSKA